MRAYPYSIIKDIKERTGLDAAPYLTCIDASPHELQAIAQGLLARSGIRHIVALQGDLVPGSGRPPMYSADLIALPKKVGDSIFQWRLIRMYIHKLKAPSRISLI